MESIKNNCYKGTRMLLGNDKHAYLTSCSNTLISLGFTSIEIPIIHPYSTFSDKVGEENDNMMYRLTDRGNRDLCLAPEYTSVVQPLASTYFNGKKDVKLFYVQKCFRGEKPQSGRFREFTQLGVEILNPSKNLSNELSLLAKSLVSTWNKDIKMSVTKNVGRGLSFYSGDVGFEISCEDLGSSKQVCGGGAYENGIGFALGIDRIMML